MYGTRSAAVNWQKCYSDLLIEHGFVRAKSNSCLFHNKEIGIRTMVHGDDFVSVASEASLIWL